MLLGDFLNTLATNSGIQADDATLKAILSNTNISGYEIADDVVNKINGAHLTVDAAKNNPTLLSHFRATVLNGLDNELNNTITELGLSDEIKGRLTAEKSSFKRASMLAKEVKALEAEKSKAAGGDKAAIQKQIDDLNAAVLEAKTTGDTKANQIKADYEGKITDMRLNDVLGSFNYGTGISKDANVTLGKTLFQTELANRKLKISTDNDKLFLETESGTKYFDNNKEVTINDFAAGVLAHHKLLATSGGTSDPEPKTIATPSGGAGGKNSFQAAAEAKASQQFD